MKRLYYCFISLCTLALVSCKDTEQNTPVLIWEADKIATSNGLYRKGIIELVTVDGNTPSDFIFRFKDGTPTNVIHQYEKDWGIGKENIDSCSCDSLLRRYKNFPLRTIFKHSEPLTQRTTNKTGDTLFIDSNIAFFSPNYVIKLPDSVAFKSSDFSQVTYLQQLQKVESPQVKIAIFDTGYDSRTSLINNPESINCPDFKDFHDGDPQLHGTTVTALLMNSMGASRNRTQIIPIKVLDSKGEGTLFRLVCGLASLKNQNVDIVNLSLGFYAPSDSIPSKLLKTYLDNTEAWIFTAAGNANQEIDSEESISSVRDLTQRHFKFYPACLTDANKLISVTSSKTNKFPDEVCNTQNFSNQYIDLAVRARYGECGIGILESYWGGQGSSFATPVAAGKTASLLRSGLQVNRNVLFNRIGVQASSPPSPQVKVGTIQSP